VADGDIATMGIAVKGSISAENHFVEGAGKCGRDFITGDVVRVEVGEIVRTVAAQVLHNEDALFGPDDWVISCQLLCWNFFDVFVKSSVRPRRSCLLFSFI
jgi:hypothetical protein